MALSAYEAFLDELLGRAYVQALFTMNHRVMRATEDGDSRIERHGKLGEELRLATGRREEEYVQSTTSLLLVRICDIFVYTPACE